MNATAPTSAPRRVSLLSSDDQARAGITSGAFELHLPGQGDRVLFAGCLDHAVALLDEHIGLPYQERGAQTELLTLIERRGGGIANYPMRWQGTRGVAYVAGTRHAPTRRLPRFQVGDRVRFALESESYTVTGITLKYLPREYRTSWQYHYGEGYALGWGVDESQARIGAAYDPSQGSGYFRAVLAERRLATLAHLNTHDAGPWHGMGRAKFLRAVSAVTEAAFAVREWR